MTNKVNFDAYTENYNDLLAAQTKFFSEDDAYFASYKVNITADQFPNCPGRILEFGCGIGRNIGPLKKAFPDAEILGSDVSKTSLDFARKENPGTEFFLEGKDTIEQKFNLIFVAGVFHHIPVDERVAVAKLLVDRLSAQGSIIIFEHNPYNPITRHIVNNCPYDEDAIIIKPKALKSILEQAGLIIENLNYCLFVPPKFKRLAYVEKFLTKLPLGGQYWISSTLKSHG